MPIVSENKVIVAKTYDFIVGVDTHARKHTFVLINNIGEKLESGEIRVLQKDFAHHLSFIEGKVAESKVLFAVEGTSSYGETLTRFLIQNGMDVCEVKPPKNKTRGCKGKTDLIDAEMGARSVLHLPIDKLIRPRIGDERKILRTLLASRNILVKQQTMEKNALMALLRGSELGIDARKALGRTATKEIATSRVRNADAPHEALSRAEAKRLADSITEKNVLLDVNKKELGTCVETLAPGLLAISCMGPVCAAYILCAYSHKGRVRSAAAFASLAGVAPLQASSGNVVRHRLSRHGDRTLNNALDVIAKQRMRFDEDTQKYVEKRTAAGSSYRETKRIIKRYIARSLFKTLEKMDLGID